ncbi:conserved Plasmodium protein, unknown function [Plasmodium sp. gorilla clade G2]|uniref:conserved Plasmodium protein, unknown function n=1 Tax=Plasmodium sp. gorilla clade G2 TaxID=880535 RepID=UPI000D21D358|nr:conserved Plasmodium protein, unknown function [Plasmodium sp. gorilla clade G2]SOV16912.1 conserved Plasmodium protein, unknown function [Plasmodium sp. gorilla clade G2]
MSTSYLIDKEQNALINKKGSDENKIKSNKEVEENVTHDNSQQNKKLFKKNKRSTTISTYSPAYISDPVYQWEVSSSDRIFYDKINDFIIHQNVSTKALLVTDIKKNKLNYNGVYVKFDKDICEDICFCQNGSFFLYYIINPNRIEISDILNNHNIYLNVDINKLNEYEILSVFWVYNGNIKKQEENMSSCDFVVVTNNSIEIFKISFDNLIITPLKKHFIKCKYCWYDEKSSYICLLSANKTNVILPYFLSNNNIIKLSKIELNILKNDNINKNDIEIITLYNETYCIHKDFKNGRISFRCLSSTIYFDYVLDLFYNGVIETFSIDNLFGVFNHTNEYVYLFDIKYNKKKNTLHSLDHNDNHTINISYLTTPKQFKTQINFNHMIFQPYNLLIDNHYGNVYKVKVDYDVLMLQICQHFSNLNTSVDVLLRRPNCKSRITEMFFLSLENDIQIEDYLSIVNIININYRKLIEECARLGNAATITSTDTTLNKTNKKIIQPLEYLLKNIGDKTLMTERDIVLDVFHPYMIKKYHLNKKETLFNFSLNFREIEKNKRDKKKGTHINNKNDGEEYMLKYKIKKKKNNDEQKNNIQLNDFNKKKENTKYHEQKNNIDLNYFNEKKENTKYDEQKNNIDLNYFNKNKENTKHDEQKNNIDLNYFNKKKENTKHDEHVDSLKKEQIIINGKNVVENIKMYDDKKDQAESNICDKSNINDNNNNNSNNNNNNVGDINTYVDTSQNNNDNEYLNFLKHSEFHNMPMLLIYVLEYMKSLLSLNIIPNRILQTFIFDLCIFFKQDNFLRQLLQFYIISDSIEVTKRLFHYWKLTKHSWAYQLCVDMSLRLKEYEMVIHLFLSSKNYLKIINFIRNYHLIDYPISVIFQAIENDFDSNDKYIIMNHILSSLKQWIIDSDREPDKYPLPNLQNCEKWVTLVEDI